jgi:hypothetical protein
MSKLSKVNRTDPDLGDAAAERSAYRQSQIAAAVAGASTIADARERQQAKDSLRRGFKS